VLQAPAQRFPAACGGPHTGAARCFLKETAAFEEPHWSRFVLKDCSL